MIGEESRQTFIGCARAAAAGVFFVMLLHIALPLKSGGGETPAGALLIGRDFLFYPLSLQNIMWVFFFVGLGELWRRFRQAGKERAVRLENPLPDDGTMLTRKRLASAHGNLVGELGKKPPQLFLPRLMRRIILQFQASESAAGAHSMLNSGAELYMHELELRYNFLRYIMWLIPTLGFIGTVIGISRALAFAGAESVIDPADGIAKPASELSNFLPQLTAQLAVAFNTTLLALLLAAVLVFLLHIAQGEEEEALNASAKYCLDNLVNRLYEDKK